MAKLSHAERSEISRKAWRKRKREGGKAKCAFCGKLIFARGVRMNGKPYHKSCAEATGAGLKPAQVGKNPREIHLRAPGDIGWHYGDRVKIKPGNGMDEFAGKIGTVIAAEGEYLRIKFDEPVYVKGVGMVRDDLWMPHTVRKIKSMNPKRITKRKRAPRDAFRYFGAEELNPLKRTIVYENDETFRIGDEVRYGSKKGIVVGSSEQSNCISIATPPKWIPVTTHVSRLDKTGKSRLADLKKLGDIWRNPKFKFGPTGFRPPAKWFAKMAQGTSASHFGRKLKELTASQRAKVGQIVGGIWAKYTDVTRLEILRKYEPSAVRALANPSMLGKRIQMLSCPGCGGLNPVSRLNVYLRCNTCGAPLRSVRVRHKR